MKYPQGRPGLNGENLASGQKPVNIRRRDGSVVGEERMTTNMTEIQRERRQQFKVERTSQHIPPRPGVTRPLRSKKPGSAAIGVPSVSGSGYSSAQKARESS